VDLFFEDSTKELIGRGPKDSLKGKISRKGGRWGVPSFQCSPSKLKRVSGGGKGKHNRRIIRKKRNVILPSIGGEAKKMSTCQVGF